MAGQTLRILDRYTYSATSAQLPAGQVALVPVAVNIPTKDAVFASLVLRLHAFDIGIGGAGSNPSVKAHAYLSAPTSEDPNTLYRLATSSVSTAKVVGLAPFTPGMDVGTLSTPGNLVGYMDVLLEVFQWSGTAANISAVVSADLVLKYC